MSNTTPPGTPQYDMTTANQSSFLALSGNQSSLLQTAKQGGTDTAAYFGAQNTTANFFSYVGQNAPGTWAQTTSDATGLPVLVAVQQGADNNLQTMQMQASLAPGVQNPSTVLQQLSWNNQSYNVAGSITTTVSYNTSPMWHFDAPLLLAQVVPQYLLGQLLKATVLAPVLRTIQGSVVRALGGLGEGGEALARLLGGETAITAGREAVINLRVGLGAVGGMVALAAVPVVLDVLSHNTSQVLQVINLSKYPLTWSLPSEFAHGALASAPATSATGQQYNYAIPAFNPGLTIPGLQPIAMAGSAQFAFGNTSGMTGITYPMTLTANDPGSGAAVDTMTVNMEIPLEGANSLGVTTGSTPGPLNSVMSASASGSKIKVTATFDYLSGQHPGPNGQNGFNYRSLIVVEAA